MRSPFSSVGPTFEEEAVPGPLLDAIRQGFKGLQDAEHACVAQGLVRGGSGTVCDGPERREAASRIVRRLSPALRAERNRR